MDRLESEIERIASACGGKLGCAVVCLEHPERGQASVLGGDPFPCVESRAFVLLCTVRHGHLTTRHSVLSNLNSMASTFKVPLAVQLLRRVDAGEISLDQMHTMQPGDYHPGKMRVRPVVESSPLRQYHRKP
jgi:hypothetical protein